MTTISEILYEFKDKVDFIVDDGDSEIGIPSTIIKIKDYDIQVLRNGPIDFSNIKF